MADSRTLAQAGAPLGGRLGLPQHRDRAGLLAPLEIFPKTARTIAHITPHAWANDAFSKLLKHGGDLVTVLPQVGVLFAFAAVTLTIATWQLRRSLTS